MRLFVAAETPDSVRESIRLYMEGLKKSFGNVVKWVAPENLHVTIKFLGEVSERNAGTVKACMDSAASATEPFTLTLEGIGFFPGDGHPRVVWIGADGGCESLLEVYQNLENCLETEGFDRDDKPFSAHLTIGRVKKFKELVLPARIPEFEPATFDVEGLSLVRSVLKPEGPVYETIYRSRFGGGSGV